MGSLRTILFKGEEDSKELKCGTCSKYLSVPPIFFSPSKDVYLCGRCHQKANEETTSKDVVLKRQTLYEEVAKYITFPCSYRIIGCRAELDWGEVLRHENACTFRNTICPLSGKNKKFLSLKNTCNWRGSSQQLVPHMIAEHRGNFVTPPCVFLQPEFETKFIFTEVLQQVMMLIFKYNQNNNKFAIYVLANLSEIECNFFRYQVEVCDDARTTSVVLRRNRIEPLCDHIFKRDTHEGFMEMDVKNMKETLKNTNSFYLKVGIVKKNKKEIKTLRANLPADSVLNADSKEPTLVIDEGILQELECPVCNDYMIPPIFICQAGHSVCDVCNKKIVTCPTCRSNMLNTRNFTLEKLTSLVNYPCKNRSTGCFFVTSSEKIRKHEQSCTLTGKNCILKCPWKGNTLEMIIHLTDKHTPLNLDTITTVILGPQKKISTEAIIYDNQVFLFTFCCGFKLPLQYSVQNLGSDNAYKYELQIVDRSGKDLNLVLRHLCSPLLVNTDKKKDKKLDHRFTLSYDLIQSLIVEDKELNYKINLFKCF